MIVVYGYCNDKLVSSKGTIMILALELIREVAYLERDNDGRVGSSMVKFRTQWHIPKSTFFRHMNALIDLEIVSRVGRDRYTIHDNHYDNVVRSKLNSDGEMQQILFM